MTIRTNMSSTIAKPRKTIMRFTGNKRKDNRYPVTFIYAGEPNAFGGYYPDRVRKALLTEDKALDLAKTYSRVGIVENLPPHFDIY